MILQGANGAIEGQVAEPENVNPTLSTRASCANNEHDINQSNAAHRNLRNFTTIGASCAGKTKHNRSSANNIPDASSTSMVNTQYHTEPRKNMTEKVSARPNHDMKCVQTITNLRQIKLENGYIKGPATVRRLIPTIDKFRKGKRTHMHLSTVGSTGDADGAYKTFWRIIKAAI